jgi:alkylhydroperoxidase family enzyme
LGTFRRSIVGLDRGDTLVTQRHVPDEAFEAVGKQFSEKAIVDLTTAAVAINTWNRIAIAFRIPRQVESKNAAA